MIVFIETSIRPFKESDLRQVTEIYQSAFAEPPWCEVWTPNEVREDLKLAFSQEKPIALVAENREITGFTWGYKLPLEKFPWLKRIVSENTSYMDEIAVRKDKRQRGTGTFLGRKFMESAKSQGFLEVVLRTDVFNQASIALFKKLGFESTGICDPKYKSRIYLTRSLNGN